jgi:hypothetical protein
MMKTIGDLRRLLAEVPESMDDAVLEIHCFECPKCIAECDAESDPYPRMRLGGTHGKIHANARGVISLQGEEPRIV